MIVFSIVTEEIAKKIVIITVVQMLICSHSHQVLANHKTIVNSIHPIISFIAATAIIRFHIFVFNKSKSNNTLAITGRAEIEKVAPINNANTHLVISRVNKGYINHQDILHIIAGISIQVMLIIATLFHCFIIFSTSISSHTTNKSINTLNCTNQSIAIDAFDEDINSQVKISGKNTHKIVGHKIIQEIISHTTAGCQRRRNNSQKSLAHHKIINIITKNINKSCAANFSIAGSIVFPINICF
jgi:hypothetical protein